jgi:hypothetical protein
MRGVPPGHLVGVLCDMRIPIQISKSNVDPDPDPAPHQSNVDPQP